YEQIASAYGIPSHTVTERQNLDAAIRKMLDTPGAYLLQVAVMEEDNVFPMCCPGHDVDDMILSNND
ncbi:MAG: acetolactate synthase large subunit, partial [Alloprevotella sp.]|nr:acetolactate synthase large subunit [Alloprevotella sp.]